MKPEKIVEIEILLKSSKDNFLFFIYESKAVYSAKACTYLHSQLPTGHSDLAGICPCGLPAYIELKAKGKLSTLKSNQKIFLTNVINHGAFAVVVDSYKLLSEYYEKFHSLKREERKTYLLSLLP